MSQRFQGKVALITGAGAGIGRAIAIRLADEGATVVGLDRESGALEETAGLLASTMTRVVADVSDPAACTAAVAEAAATHGRLDVLGNVAGIARAEHMQDVTVEQYRQIMSVNVDACFFLSQAAIPHLVRSRGNLVTISSTAGLMGQAYTVTYCMSKAAVIQMTKAMAMEFLKTGVRINAIAPGGINTPLVQNFQVPDDVDGELMNRYAAVRGVGEPEDVASLFAYLASEEARTIHGAVVSVDHGMTAG